MTAKLLIIDDDSMIQSMMERMFEEQNYELYQAMNSQDGLELIKEARPHVVILDIQLPGKSGLEVLKEIKLISSDITVIMMTGFNSTKVAIESMRYGAFDYVTKPFDVTQMSELVERALSSNLLSRKVRFSKAPPKHLASSSDEDIMIGTSPEMLEIWKMVGKVADSNETVLIHGESGTGKELLARAIYDNSRRQGNTFLAVNCAALPESIVESELFGHEKGAFTDAHVRKIGKFEQCHDGTLFLDEIAELSLENQGKLLRVLENQTFMRVGGNKEIKVDVRIIAATNKSLISEVKAGRFRLDLFYRLRIITFFLPPLRERKNDIPQLIDLFMLQQNRKTNKNIVGISPEAVSFLLSCPWRGNIRELKNAINAAVVYAKSDVLQVDDFSQILNQDERKIISFNDSFKAFLINNFPEFSQTHQGEIHQNLTETMDQVLAMLAMEQCSNSQVAAAKLLGVSRNTLRKWLELNKTI